jgi:hypothetical protein
MRGAWNWVVEPVVLAGLEVSPNKGRGKDNEYRDDGYGDKYRIGWHGWSPVRGA